MAGATLGSPVGKNPSLPCRRKQTLESIACNGWLMKVNRISTESSLLTADFIMQGVMASLAGGDAAWAFGYERREYNLEAKSPCSVPGRTFLQTKRKIYLMEISILVILPGRKP